MNTIYRYIQESIIIDIDFFIRFSSNQWITNSRCSPSYWNWLISQKAISWLNLIVTVLKETSLNNQFIERQSWSDCTQWVEHEFFYEYTIWKYLIGMDNFMINLETRKQTCRSFLHGVENKYNIMLYHFTISQYSTLFSLFNTSCVFVDNYSLLIISQIFQIG